MNDFYVTLPSNSSMRDFPTNTLTNYITRLPKRFDLHGKWYVGLVEMQYPRSWFNIPESAERIVTFINNQDDIDHTDSVTAMDEALRYISENTKNFRIEPGYYTPSLLKDALNDNFYKELKTDADIRVKYDNASQLFTIITKRHSVHLTDYLSRLMGYEGGEFYLGEGIHPGGYVDMEPIHSLYVYCDLIEPRVVGDVFAPLLRLVPVSGKHGDTITVRYENVHYLPLQRKQFSTIEIDIKDHTGKNIPFERGTLNVTLHFKRKNQL